MGCGRPTDQAFDWPDKGHMAGHKVSGGRDIGGDTVRPSPVNIIICRLAVRQQRSVTSLTCVSILKSPKDGHYTLTERAFAVCDARSHNTLR